eukprot:CAMPEP_0113937172 /NCGR_PEP_ID=MMETSP1339-20121228/3859_1 /TAXON_ID=94617 /ORGANISM="Fibrocapsa japonica" /LENGTH=197 /DNA_ID=CAMNT_0000939847 /DNA_START=283 /DNA_END=876 /DNA_ORIENTATION=+ /assembly_acc=CAM_ASM_000762
MPDTPGKGFSAQPAARCLLHCIVTEFRVLLPLAPPDKSAHLLVVVIARAVVLRGLHTSAWGNTITFVPEALQAAHEAATGDAGLLGDISRAVRLHGAVPEAGRARVHHHRASGLQLLDPRAILQVHLAFEPHVGVKLQRGEVGQRVEVWDDPVEVVEGQGQGLEGAGETDLRKVPFQRAVVSREELQLIQAFKALGQ